MDGSAPAPAPGAGDTIAARATAAGAAGIGVLRVSGPASAGIARALLGRAPRPRHAHLCSFRDAAGSVLDRGLLLHFPAPHSYTGEDVLELQCHGSPVLLEALLERLVELGARRAGPGEFTQRAFLNGKLDLAQAEAVADLISASSVAAVRAAQRSLEGAFSARVQALVEAVIRARMWIEAAIDFAEEEIDFLAAPELRAQLDAVAADLAALQATARSGARLARGVHAVIIGRPNAGKSSLLNALAGRARAIVTDVPGTTRDLVHEEILLDGVGLGLVDTAGLRAAGDAIEREGIARARAELARADLALLVTTDRDCAADLALLAGLPADAAALVLHNKIDLDGGAPRREMRAGREHIWLSARSGAGLDLLRAALRRHAGAAAAGEDAVSARGRHVEALGRAATHLAAARAALAHAGEIAAEELRDMQRELGSITGSFTSDDLLGRIFADFCIGK